MANREEMPKQVNEKQSTSMTIEERRAYTQRMKLIKEEHYKRKEKLLRQKTKEEEGGRDT